MAEFGKALQRGLDILEVLHRVREPMAFSELRKEVTLSPASFTRFLKLLVERGYVAQGSDGHYRLGWRLGTLGLTALEQSPLQVCARPHLEAIMDATQEAAEVAQFSDASFVFLHRVESPRAVVLKARAGSVFPVTDNTAIGVLALGLGRPGLPSAMPEEELDAVRATGYADKLQNGDEVLRAAAAVFDHTNSCIGCLTVAAPAFRVKARKRAQFRDILQDHARAVSQALGCRDYADAARSSGR